MGNIDEEFEAFESKVNEVAKILELMNNESEGKQETGLALADKFFGTDQEHQNKLSKDEFIVKVKEDRSVINTTSTNSDADGQSSKMIFMQEMERDAARRAKERKERELVAQNLRKLGNQAFRQGEYEKAISMYSKALDHVRDSPILYNNRALSYIRLGMCEKAIIDSDFVIQKLDEKNLRSWLNRAKGYYLLGEKRDFEKSINEARKNNPKDLEFIEKTVSHILSE